MAFVAAAAEFQTAPGNLDHRDPQILVAHMGIEGALFALILGGVGNQRIQQ